LFAGAAFAPAPPPGAPAPDYDTLAARVLAAHPAGTHIQYIATPAYTGPGLVEVWLERGRDTPDLRQWRECFSAADLAPLGSTADSRASAILAGIGHFHGNLFLGDLGAVH
jgi:hypothetical protein